MADEKDIMKDDTRVRQAVTNAELGLKMDVLREKFEDLCERLDHQNGKILRLDKRVLRIEVLIGFLGTAAGAAFAIWQALR